MVNKKRIKEFKVENNLLRNYLLFVFLRILLVFLPQSGYIHPDEFFQSVEVMAGDEMGLEHIRTWEFNNTFPVRSVGISFFVYRVPYNLFVYFVVHLYYFLGIDLRTSYMLVIFPRIIMCALSFINDWSLYKICRSYGLKYEIRLLALASSYIMLVFSTRTFSNTIEMALCSLLIYFVAECMVHSNSIIFQAEYLTDKYNEATITIEKVKYFKMRSALPAHSLNKCILLAALCVTGCFNRPTFIIFGMPIIFFWLLRGLGSKTVTFLDFNMRVINFILWSIPFTLFYIFIDSIYYGYLTGHDIYTMDISMNSFVVTPLNFIRYNINPANTGQHGVHPKYLHLLINLPLLYNILGIVAIVSCCNLIFKFGCAEYKTLPRSQSAISLMNSAIFIPVLILSLINHQEPRFLIPVTLPIILLHAPKLQTGFVTANPFNKINRLTTFLYERVLSTKASAGYILQYWYLINIILTIFFGFIHQGGVISLVRHLSRSPAYDDTFHAGNRVDTHLVTSHTYSVPISLLFMPSTQTLLDNTEGGQKYTRRKNFFTYEYGNINMVDLHKKIKLIVDVGEMKWAKEKRPYKLLVAIPSSLTEDFAVALYRSNNTFIKYRTLKVFYPHLSTEALPTLFAKYSNELTTNALQMGQLDHMNEANETGEQDDLKPFSIEWICRKLSLVTNQFGLVLYKIEIRKSRT